jgi:hypothetical protein
LFFKLFIILKIIKFIFFIYFLNEKYYWKAPSLFKNVNRVILNFKFVFIKKILFLYFSDHFNMLISKIIFKK